MIQGILGIVGGVLCACGDLLLDLKGNQNKKLGKYKFIESNWEVMGFWRFKISLLLAMVGVPLYFLGFNYMAEQLKVKNEVFGQIFWMVSLVGSIGGFFIHAFLCAMPVIYKTMLKQSGFSLTGEVLNRVHDLVKIPFFIMYIMLIGITSLMMVYGVWANYLFISPVTLLLTPLSLLIIGEGLKKI